jgi:hypothetical protein
MTNPSPVIRILHILCKVHREFRCTGCPGIVIGCFFFENRPDSLVMSQFSYTVHCTFFEMLRRIFGPKRDEVMGGWRKLHNEELHNLYSSPIIIRIIK